MAELDLNGLLPLMQQQPAFEQLCRDLERARQAPGSQPTGLHVLAAARPFLVAALAAATGRPIILVTARPEVGLHFVDQLRLWLGEAQRILDFPDPGALPYERAPWSVERVQRRIQVLTALTQPKVVGGAPLVVTSARALLHPTIPLEMFQRHVRSYSQGQTISLRFLLASWYAMGYESTNIVSEPGQYSHRGGILDIFPTNQVYPARLELWGDEIDSIRLFDPASQRSIETLTELVVPPASEALLVRDVTERAASQLRALDCSGCHEPIQGEIQHHIGMIQEGQRFPGVEFYLPYLYEQPGSVLDYLPENGLLLIDDWSGLELNVSDVEQQALRLRDDLVGRGELPDAFGGATHTWDDLRDFFSQRPPIVLGYGVDEAEYGLGDLFQAGPRYGGRLSDAMTAIRRQAGQVTQVLVSKQAERMAELLANEGIVARPRGELRQPPTPGSLALLQGSVSEGFILGQPDEGLPGENHEPGSNGETEPDFADGPRNITPLLSLITDAELFGWSRVAPRRSLRARKRPTSENFFAEIETGDYVVHLEHGIGIYRGLVQREINSITREYLELEYAQGDKLYVPVHQSDRVSRYIGTGEGDPGVHRLGTADWKQAQQRAKRAVEEIAEELLELYAAREAVTGFAFAPDTPWQAEIEGSFPYTETEDQLRAIEDVKRDMEQPKPMDRLVVGDVGFGKTEVALRAAFKAVMDSKQVAILVPTTVLAQQHFSNFSQRLSNYPVKVEMLSRFRSASEQREILEKLGEGQVDIIIGTHRLLSSDVRFKDLGLLVIDEEQRFGVTHKERLKQLRREVDVLTLSATPIPRTLHMALTGVRDMSTIDTPPEDRLPIVTKVMQWEDTQIKMAILREIDRGGQIFFVHNRVLSIYALTQRLQKLVPEATFTVAHGQMNEHELEQVMYDFANGKYDVLVCTAIIESGLDLPNVNTIIMDHAEMFGLAQLYQLRGRVGRGARRGYAYLVHPRETTLTQEALERLDAIREATELGAGFRIALKDLEIRGAGDLLGARQSGHIAAVGFDMYAKLLAQAVRELRERREQPEKPAAETVRARQEVILETGPSVDLPLQAHLPLDFIPDDDVRLRLYRRMAEATTLDEAADIEQELRDRFGELAPPAANLVYILRLRLLAAQAHITGIGQESGQISVQLPGPGALRAITSQNLLDERVVRYGRREFYIDTKVGEAEWKQCLEQALLTLAARAEGERAVV
jgi:transcription-repair coupling factor (superfamily II helicase)